MVEKSKKNVRLRTPQRQKGKMIFNAIKKGTLDCNGNHFHLVWDDTDHFDFVCTKCFEFADVLRVEFQSMSELGAKDKMTFRLECRKCKGTGHRKIYITSGASSARDSTMCKSLFSIPEDKRTADKS